MQVLIAYHSDYGRTEQIARAIAAGIEAVQPDSPPQLLHVEQTKIDAVVEAMRSADLLVLGAPVHMGGIAWPMRRLLDATSRLWSEGAMEGRFGAAFVTFGGLGGAGGGAELALLSIWAVFAELGMLPIGCPRSMPGYAEAGLHWGLAARTGDSSGMPRELTEPQRAAARAFGIHLAETAGRLRSR